MALLQCRYRNQICRKKQRAIYPQILVGKLLPMATVDQNSVYWLEIPSDRSFVTFDYDKHDIDFGDPSFL